MLSKRLILLLAALPIVATLGFVVLPAAQSVEAPPAVAEELPAVVAKLPGFDPAWLAPIEGVGVRRFAHVVFEMFAGEGQDMPKLLARHGLTEAKVNRISEVIATRMREDKSFKFAEIYGAYYQEAATGQFAKFARDMAHSVLNGVPLAEREPMTWDEFRVVQGYYARKSPFARDTSLAALDEILAPKKMTFIDFQVLGAWFGRRLALESR